MNALEQKIESLIEPSLKGMGFDVVRIKLTEGSRRTLQIMAERTGDNTITLDECAVISRTASAILDVADPITDEYVLEVSSPGIDRPLIRLPDYERFKGFVAKVQLTMPIDGRKRFQGDIIGVEGQNVHIKLSDSADVSVLPFHLIDSAKLVLTDELIKQHQPTTNNQ